MRVRGAESPRRRLPSVVEPVAPRRLRAIASLGIRGGMRIARARASDLGMRLLSERAGVRVRWVARILAAVVGIGPFRWVWIIDRVRQRVMWRGVLRDVAGVLARGLGEAADR